MKANQIVRFDRKSTKDRIKKTFSALSRAMQKTNDSFSDLSNALAKMQIYDD
jgi:hypothetical protein